MRTTLDQHVIVKCGSVTNLSLYDVLFKVLCLVGDPEHGHGEGKIQHHLLKDKSSSNQLHHAPTTVLQLWTAWGTETQTRVLLTLNISILTPMFLHGPPEAFKAFKVSQQNATLPRTFTLFPGFSFVACAVDTRKKKKKSLHSHNTSKTKKNRK